MNAPAPNFVLVDSLQVANVNVFVGTTEDAFTYSATATPPGPQATETQRGGGSETSGGGRASHDTARPTPPASSSLSNHSTTVSPVDRPTRVSGVP